MGQVKAPDVPQPKRGLTDGAMKKMSDTIYPLNLTRKVSEFDVRALGV